MDKQETYSHEVHRSTSSSLNKRTVSIQPELILNQLNEIVLLNFKPKIWLSECWVITLKMWNDLTTKKVENYLYSMGADLQWGRTQNHQKLPDIVQLY